MEIHRCLFSKIGTKMTEKKINILQYLKLLSWKYLSFTRPSNLTVNGKLFFNRYSSIKFCKYSQINIAGDFDLSGSELILKSSIFSAGKIVINNSIIALNKSKITLGDLAHLKNANLNLIESQWNAFNNCRVHGTEIGANKSTLEIGNYFFAQNNSADFLKWNLINAKMFVGDNTRLQCAISLNNANFKIGSNSFINAGTSVSSIAQIVVGNYVMISYDCLIFDNNSHALDYKERRLEIEQGFPNGTQFDKLHQPKSAPIIIKNDVWIGARCTILKGITMEEKSVAASNTIVTRNVNESMLVYGNPNQYKPIVIE